MELNENDLFLAVKNDSYIQLFFMHRCLDRHEDGAIHP
jgi:hypothetical protein